MPGYRYTVKFFLQKSEPKNEPTQLRCFVRYNGKVVPISTAIKIEPRYWNKNKNVPKETAELQNSDKIKNDLSNVRKWVSETFDYLTAKDGCYPDKQALRDLCKEVIKGAGHRPDSDSGKIALTLTGYIERLIGDTKSGKRAKSNGARFNPGTVKHYNSAFGVIKKYAGSVGKPLLYFSDIDLDFYYNFKDWAYSREPAISDNYFGATIKFLKTCMNEAAEEGLHTNVSHNNKRFVKVQAEVENIYLNAEQLDQIMKADLKGNLKLERVRDLFLVSCWTGLRFSDTINIQPENIDGGFIQIKTQKTGETIAIPIHATVKNIMAKYAGITFNSLPPAISNVKMNEYLKDLGKVAGLKEIKTLDKAQGGKTVKVNKPLYELITTHTARRSFASNMFRMGVPTMVIIGVTGHKTESSFMKYIKVSPREKAQIMQEAWTRQAMKVINGD